jgi:hypothetical protein
MKAWIGLAFALLVGGCDSLFSIDHVTLEADGGGGGGDDAVVTGDGALCDPIKPDEDSDGLVDDCDACPTIPSKDAGDMDSDGLPDPCDPHETTGGDKIVFKAMFATADDLEKFATTPNAAYSTANHGIVTLKHDGAVAAMTTVETFTPYEVEVNVAGIASTSTSQKVLLTTASVDCNVYFCGTSSTCAVLAPGGGSPATLGTTSPSALAQILMTQSGSGVQCTIKGNGATGTSSTNGFVPTAISIQVADVLDTAVFVKSVVIYGS